MKKNRLIALLPAFLLFLLVSCLTSGDRGQVLTMKITDKNDSLLSYDSLIVTVHSKDGKFSQEVFHGVLRDRKQVESLPLDPRVGEDYSITIVGYMGGKVAVNKEVTFVGSTSQSKDLPIKPDTVTIDPNLPEIVSPTDTMIPEGDSLRFRVIVLKPWSGKTTLGLKEVISGAKLDTVDRDPGEGYFAWRPTFDQGRSEAYSFTFVYASTDKKVEKVVRIKVLNVNRPPKLESIPDQQVRENELLTFKVAGSDPDQDSLRLAAKDLPSGATFAAGTFAWKPSEGQAGNYSVTFRAFDNSDTDRVTVLITVGNVQPPPPVTVKIVFPLKDTLVNSTPFTVQYSVNGTSLQKKVELKDGKNRIRIDTTILGRSGFDTVLITLDTIPPGAPSVAGVSPIRTRTPTWTWASSGNGSGVFRYRLDSDDMTGSTVLTTTTYTASKDLDIGTHTLYVQERDEAGNWSTSGRRAVRIDTTKPSAPSVTVTPVSPTNNLLPTWNWLAAGEDLSGIYRYKLDTNDFRAGAVETEETHFTPDKPLKEGMHTLFVQQQDSAGNWSNSGSAWIAIDLSPPGKPVLKAGQASPTNNRRPSWNLSSGGGAGIYRVKMDDSNLTQGAKSGPFSTFTPDSDLGEGVHTLFAQERDSAGNWSGTQSLAIMVDLTPPAAPVFEAKPLSPLNSLQPSWTWKSGGGGMGTYRYKLDDSALAQGADTLRAGLFKPATALSEGLHSFYLQERDSAGNWSAVASKKLVLSTRKELGGIGITPDAAYEVSVAFSNDGVAPYLCFRDAANGDKATVMRFNGTSWDILGTAGFTSGRAYAPNLAISSSGIPYVAYVDVDNGEKITVMSFNGGAWELVGVSGISQGRAYGPSLAFTKEGVAYVAYRDLANGRKASVLRFPGGHWEQVGTAGFTSVGASFVSLAITSGGVPHLAFCKDSLGKQAIMMRFNGTNWVDFGSGTISSGSASSTSLLFSTSDVPYVSYVDEADNGKAAVKRLLNNVWENVGAPGFTPGAAFTLALALSRDDKPFVVFGDGANGRRARAMAFTGTAWETIGPAEGLSSGGSYSTDIAVSALGVPYVAFLDDANGDKATVVKTSFDP